MCHAKLLDIYNKQVLRRAYTIRIARTIHSRGSLSYGSQVDVPRLLFVGLHVFFISSAIDMLNGN